MGVLHRSGRFVLALLGLLLSLTPLAELFLILLPLQPRDFIEYGLALIVAFPTAIVFVRRKYSLKRLGTFLFTLYVLGLFLALLIGGLSLVVSSVFNISPPSLSDTFTRLGSFLLATLLVALLYWISYRTVYAIEGN